MATLNTGACAHSPKLSGNFLTAAGELCSSLHFIQVKSVLRIIMNQSDLTALERINQH